MSQVELTYDKETDIVYINAHQKDFVPAYLKYLLQWLKIPNNAPIVFIKDQPKQKEKNNGSNADT